MIGLSFDKITWWSGREGPRFSYIVRTGSSLQLSWEQDVHHDYSDDDIDEDEDDLLQDGNSPVALSVVAGRVEERDADHRHRRGDRQRRDPPGNY